MEHNCCTNGKNFAQMLFLQLLIEQPCGDYTFAGCAKDGSEGPPPKTPPPPPPGIDDFRAIIERIIRDILQGQTFVRMKPGAGILGMQRSPVEFVRADTHIDAAPPKRVFLVTYTDRGDIDEETLPSLMHEHAQHLRSLSDEGYLEATAAYASGQSGIKIILADTKAEAERIATSDPLLSKGYYKRFDFDELLPFSFGDC